MVLKAAFKNASVFVQLLMLLAVIFFCTTFFTFIGSLLILSKVGLSPEIIQEMQQHLNFSEYPDLLRGLQFLQTLGIFIFPPLICAWLFSDNYKEYFGLDNPIQLPVAFWTFVSVLAAIPFLNLTHSINQQMVFPEALKGLETWMKEMEESAAQIMDKLLYTKDIKTVVFNILVVCVLAGIGEELMFRGVLQTLGGKLIRNPHVLIWVIAILFSAIHFQFYGFITRMLLGVWLGYLMYFTKTIWIPALAHFTNNFFGICMYYIFQDAPDKVQAIDSIGTGSTGWLSVASLALFAFCFMQIKKTINHFSFK
jgi:membrane protease YdiL (CAAX protease family)